MLPGYRLALYQSLQPCSLRCTDWRSRQVCLDNCRHSPGKRPQMDVGFGLYPDKCYSKPVKAKFVTRNSSLPTGHLTHNYFIIVWSEQVNTLQLHKSPQWKKERFKCIGRCFCCGYFCPVLCLTHTNHHIIRHRDDILNRGDFRPF